MALEIKEEWQKYLVNFSNEQDFDKPYIRQFFINNIIQRVLSLLYAIDKDTGEPVKLKCLPDGSLMVAQTVSGLTNNETFTGTSGDTETEIEFTQIVSRVDIWVWDNDMKIARSYDGLTYQDWITLKADSFYSFDAGTKKIKVVNATAGLNANYQIVGWW